MADHHERIHWADIGRISPGDEARISERITSETIAAMAQVTGDDNPVHVDPSAVRALGQSQPVAHGLILLGMVSRLIGTRLPGPGSVWYENQVTFLAPVFPGDEIEIGARVVRVSRGTKVVVLDLTGRKVGGAEVLRGRARVRISRVLDERTVPMTCERVVVVTGASRGIGRVIAESLGARGMRVIINCRSDSAGAEACQAAVRAGGGEALIVPADVATPAGCDAIVSRTLGEFGRLDAIVHAATPPIATRPYLDTDSEEFRAYFDTYVLGLHELLRRAVPGMRERRYGRIVAVLSSFIAEVPQKLSAYIAGKYALLGFCRALAVELGPWNISVNAVSPSMVIGPYADTAGFAAREVMIRKTPLRRLAEPDDVARAVAFLLGDEASFISGANIPVAGGILV